MSGGFRKDLLHPPLDIYEASSNPNRLKAQESPGMRWPITVQRSQTICCFCIEIFEARFFESHRIAPTSVKQVYLYSTPPPPQLPPPSAAHFTTSPHLFF